MLTKDNYFMKIEGTNSIVTSKVNGHTIFLNKVATWLFNHLNACTSSEELLEKMVHQFNGVNPDILKKDLMSFLHVMEVYQIVALHSSEGINEDVAYRISFADDNTYKRICDFIYASETKNWLIKPIQEKQLTPLALHQKHFANEEMFLYYVKNNETKIVVSFKMPIPESKVLVLNRIYTKNIDEEELVMGILQVIQRFMTKITDVPSKTRVIVFECEKDCVNHDSVVKLLQKCGFSKECELKNEINDINVHYYCLINS